MSSGEAPIGFQVKNLLSAGFGVEDISLRLKIHEYSVRFHVRHLRETGELKNIYGRKSSVVGVSE